MQWSVSSPSLAVCVILPLSLPHAPRVKKCLYHCDETAPHRERERQTREKRCEREETPSSFVAPWSLSLSLPLSFHTPPASATRRLASAFSPPSRPLCCPDRSAAAVREGRRPCRPAALACLLPLPRRRNVEAALASAAAAPCHKLHAKRPHHIYTLLLWLTLTPLASALCFCRTSLPSCTPTTLFVGRLIDRGFSRDRSTHSLWE